MKITLTKELRFVNGTWANVWNMQYFHPKLFGAMMSPLNYSAQLHLLGSLMSACYYGTSFELIRDYSLVRDINIGFSFLPFF